MLSNKAQYSTEYVIIIGIGVAIIASFLIYVMLFYGSFSSSSSASQIKNVASSISKEADYVSSQGVGSIQAFPITIPLLQQKDSFLCGDIIKLQTTTELGVAKPAENISGMLPLTGGTYDAFVKSVNGQVVLGLRFAISYISQSYSVSGTTISYNLEFYNYSFQPVTSPVTFNISVLSTNGVYLGSAVSSTSSSSPSTASGSVTASAYYPEYVIEVTPSSSGDYASQCVSAQQPIAYVPLTITSSSATPNPFQQEVTVNMQDYNSYANSNLQNIEFLYPNSTVIPSWRENGTSNNQVVTYWLKLGSFTSTTVYMDFFPQNENVLNTVNTGEAPQLSSTYAEYDDGQDVFLEYGDFLGSAGFDGWTGYVTSGSFSPTPSSQGIEMINDTGSEGTHILPPKPMPEIPSIVEYSWNFYGGTSPTDGEILSLFGNVNSLVGPPVVTCGGGNVASSGSVMLMVEPIGMNCSGSYIPVILDSQDNKIISTVNNLPSTTPQTYTEELIVSTSTQAEAGVINQASSLENFSNINIPLDMSGSIPSAFNYPTLMVAAGSGGGYDYNYIKWLIARSYPPSGVMPSVSFGSIA